MKGWGAGTQLHPYKSVYIARLDAEHLKSLPPYPMGHFTPEICLGPASTAAGADSVSCDWQPASNSAWNRRPPHHQLVPCMRDYAGT